jgi:hypothetical protein
MLANTCGCDVRVKGNNRMYRMPSAVHFGTHWLAPEL